MIHNSLLLPSFFTFFNYIKLENELQLLYYLIWIICKFLIPFANENNYNKPNIGTLMCYCHMGTTLYWVSSPVP
jgi:hypothetical protein